MSDLAVRRFEPRVSRLGGTSGGLGRGARGFWSKVRKSGLLPGACWEWIGYLDKDGYGKFCTTRGLDGTLFSAARTVRPHRFLWEHLFGLLDSGAVLMHLCDNPRCVNPDHLRPGTQQENIRDCYARGRHTNMADTRGEMSGMAQIRNEDVLFIRSQQPAYGLNVVLGRLFGVKPQVVACVRCRKTWRHLGNGNRQNAMPLAQLVALANQRESERANIEHFAGARPGDGEPT